MRPSRAANFFEFVWPRVTGDMAAGLAIQGENNTCWCLAIACKSLPLRRNLEEGVCLKERESKVPASRAENGQACPLGNIGQANPCGDEGQ